MASGTRTYNHNINAGGEVGHRDFDDLIAYLFKLNLENAETDDLTILCTITQASA